MKLLAIFTGIAFFIMQNIYGIDIPSQSSPSDGETEVHTNAVLWINQVSGATYYDFMLDTVTTFDSPALREYSIEASYSGWRPGDLFYNKTYYWKIRARTSSDTSAWSSVWSFTTTLYGCTLDAPADGATDLGTKVTLWINQLGSENYDYQVDTVPTFDSPYLREFSHSDSYTGYGVPDLLYGQTYYWRARGRNDADSSEWTPYRTFTTTLYGATQYSPANGSTNLNVHVTLWINTVSGSEDYDYQLDTSETFDSPVLQEFTHSDSYVGYGVPNLRYGQTYYWRVRGRNDSDTSVWTDPWYFVTNIYGATPRTPDSGAVNVSVKPTLWINTVDGADFYDFQIDTTPSFNSPLLSEPTLDGSYEGIILSDSLRYGTVYYWRVRGRNDTATSIWSYYYSFTTEIELNAPVLVTPANDSTDAPFDNITIAWQSVSGAINYYYEVSDDVSFNNIVTSGSTSLTFATINDLYPNTTYYWRVKAEDNNGFSGWSDVWHFTTLSVALEQPVLISPDTASVITETAPQFLWHSVYGANAYKFQISTDSLFSFYTEIETTDTTVGVTGLSNANTYFWRVLAIEGSIESQWSNVWKFTIIDDLNAPTLISPENGAENTELSLVLDWSDVNYAESYEYQYDTDASFSNPLKDTVTESEVTISGLNENTLYYWRVRSLSNDLASVWSDVWHFTTGEPFVLYDFSDELTIYPNPANDLIYVTGAENGDTYEVFNLIGKLMDTGTIQNASISLKNLESGIYLIKINSRMFRIRKL